MVLPAGAMVLPAGTDGPPGGRTIFNRGGPKVQVPTPGRSLPVLGRGLRDPVVVVDYAFAAVRPHRVQIWKRKRNLTHQIIIHPPEIALKETKEMIAVLYGKSTKTRIPPKLVR